MGDSRERPALFKMNIEALDIVTPVIGGIILTVIACERGREPNWFYCVDENGNGGWFVETELRIAKSSDLKK